MNMAKIPMETMRARNIGTLRGMMIPRNLTLLTFGKKNIKILFYILFCTRLFFIFIKVIVIQYIKIKKILKKLFGKTILHSSFLILHFFL